MSYGHKEMLCGVEECRTSMVGSLKIINNDVALLMRHSG
jgi:hypothetical protein